MLHVDDELRKKFQELSETKKKTAQEILEEL